MIAFFSFPDCGWSFYCWSSCYILWSFSRFTSIFLNCISCCWIDFIHISNQKRFFRMGCWVNIFFTIIFIYFINFCCVAILAQHWVDTLASEIFLINSDVFIRNFYRYLSEMVFSFYSLLNPRNMIFCAQNDCDNCVYEQLLLWIKISLLAAV